MATVFMGSKALGYAIMRALHRAKPGILDALVLCDDTADERSVLAQFTSYADQHSLAYRIVRNRAEAKAALVELAPEAALVCGWYWLFDEATINLPPRGIWGIHNSLLPRYRGGSPLVWGLINGEPSVGATLFRMTEGMDDGPYLRQFALEVGAQETIADILDRLERQISEELPRLWLDFIDGRVLPTEQDHSQATFCGLRSPEDGLIDWSMPAVRVHDFIRAQAPPYPCAYTHANGRLIRITRSRVSSQVWQGTPGQVLLRAGDEALVACGGRTALNVIQGLDESGRAMPGAAVLSSIKIRLK